MIEGSRSGSIPQTNGSGSGSKRQKTMWIRIQIRIRNTGGKGKHIFWHLTKTFQPQKLKKQSLEMFLFGNLLTLCPVWSFWSACCLDMDLNHRVLNWLIDDQAFSPSYDFVPHPPFPVSKLSLFLSVAGRNNWPKRGEEEPSHTTTRKPGPL